MTEFENGTDQQAVEQIQKARERIHEEIGKLIIGQKEIIDHLLFSIFSGGHCLIVGVPGLAKTLIVSTLSSILDLEFSRIQFTPDLMPSDITGTDIIQEDPGTGNRGFKFIPGPIFANVVLADEINRTPPKTQAALLQAMQEHQVTTGVTTRKLKEPFFVLATQNPIEQEGTYPLPEAQLDRFMFMLYIQYPGIEEEIEIVQTTTSRYSPVLGKVMSGEDIVRLQSLVRKVPVSDEIVRFAVGIANGTRPSGKDAPDFIRDFVAWGAGPRASQYLILGGKTRAVLLGRYTPTEEDVMAVARPVLRHRIVTSFNAEAEGVTVDALLDRYLERFTSV
jgi:MoxR-like ATPase